MLWKVLENVGRVLYNIYCYERCKKENINRILYCKVMIDIRERRCQDAALLWMALENIKRML